MVPEMQCTLAVVTRDQNVTPASVLLLRKPVTVGILLTHHDLLRYVTLSIFRTFIAHYLGTSWAPAYAACPHVPAAQCMNSRLLGCRASRRAAAPVAGGVR